MPITLSPVVPERHAGTSRVLACQPCSLNHHPNWNLPPTWAYPLPHPRNTWDNDPAIVLIDHTYQLGGAEQAARLIRTRTPMCPKHAEMYLGEEKLRAFLANQPRQTQEQPA